MREIVMNYTRKSKMHLQHQLTISDADHQYILLLRSWYDKSIVPLYYKQTLK